MAEITEVAQEYGLTVSGDPPFFCFRSGAETIVATNWVY